MTVEPLRDWHISAKNTGGLGACEKRLTVNCGAIGGHFAEGKI